MIEQLELRTLFSLTPHAALLALRSDVASIGHTIYTLIRANQSAVANLNHDLLLFPATAASDNGDLRYLNFQFNSQLATLITDYTNIKTLFNQDIIQLVNTCDDYNRHPTATNGLAVQISQQLLSSEGSAASAALSQDCAQAQQAYQRALQLLASTHPIDTTFEARISHISAGFVTNIAPLESAAATVAATDIPSFITALEPNGIPSPAMA